MKKITLLFAIVAGSALFLQSCDKLKNKVVGKLDPFNFTQQTFELPIPIMSSTAVYTSTGIDTVDIDLNQIMKDNAPKDSKGKPLYELTTKNISSLTLEKITLTLLDHNSTNNLSNFDSVKAYINSDAGISKGKNDIFLAAWCNDVTYNAANQTLVINGDSKMELMDYLTGSKVYYWFKARARRATNKEMRIKMVIDYKLVPKL